MMLRYFIVLLLVCSACACNEVKHEGISTLKDLEGQNVHVRKSTLDAVNPDTVIASYQAILASVDDEELRKETMLRLADLQIEMQDYLDSSQTDSSRQNQHDYSKAIHQYIDFLKSYPDYSGNDHVLYQLAKAYELNGQLDLTIDTLKRLVAQYPTSSYVDEANFRCGELQFVLKSYTDAIQAYDAVISKGDSTYFYEKALYKQGWALYKSSHPYESLHSFTVLLDRKLANITASDTDNLSQELSTGDLELVDDTLRVISLIFSSFNDTNAVARYFSQNGNRNYEYLIYQHLGEFYQAQERIKDAADTYYSFIYSHPLHRQSPYLEIKAIEAYQESRFVTLLQDAKEDFVNRYQSASTYWSRLPEEVHSDMLPYLKKYATELARYHHAIAQKTKQQRDYDVAVYWYRVFLSSFPTDSTSPEMNFLLAELLFENGQYAEAAREYERTAYDYAEHDKGAEAGYSALLAYSEAEKTLDDNNVRSTWQRQAIASALRFADRYPHDEHLAAVLAKTANELFDLGENTQAVEVARRVIDISSRKQADLRLTAWTIVGHAAFDSEDFESAERAYVQAIRLHPDKGDTETELQERLAASIYKQGEQARAGNDLETAADHFLRVGKVVPTSAIRSTAEFDAATIYLTLKNWGKAIKVLEEFRDSYPDHPLQNKVTAKLAVAYLENGDPKKAAAQFDTIAATSPDEDVQRDAILQAAGLYKKTGNTTAAIEDYKRFVKNYPQPLEAAIEVRHDIADIYLQSEQIEKYKYWLRQIIRADKAGGSSRTNRTLYLAAQASFALAKYDYEFYESIKLKAPLEKSLMKKKKAMENTLEAYKHVLDYNIAEMTTASSYQIASTYTDFSKALMNSQRPRGLSDLELEQYNVLLEEQAYPFEEEAIAAHELNAQRVTDGIYDDWVKKSFTALAKLLPVRYAKSEKSEEFINGLK